MYYIAVHCNIYIYVVIYCNPMSSAGLNKNSSARTFNSILDAFRNDFERTNSIPFNSRWDFPTWIEEKEIRLALYELIDKGDRFEVSLELPGIDKKNIDVKAAKSFIEVSATKSERKEETTKNLMYNERSWKTLYRNIPLPEEIISDKVTAKIENGILQVEMPKKVNSQSEPISKIEVQ